MRTCHCCQRHLLGEERACPFCGAVRRTIVAPWPTVVIAVALVAIAGCTGRTLAKDGSGADSSDGTPTTPHDDGSPDGGGTGTGGPDGGGTSTGGPDGGSTGTDDGSDTGDGWTTGDDGGAFYGMPPPDGGVVGECDPGLQDCPNPDEKCTAYATEPGSCCVDATKCVPIIGDKSWGESCERFEENDDCAKGFFCLTATSGGTGEGVCLEFCVPNAPNQCQSDGSTCQSFHDGILPLCAESCDPVLQDCPNVMGCYAAFDDFICVNLDQAGAGDDGDECHAIQSCVPGLVCVSPDAYGPGCTGEACCTAFCDVNDGGAGNPACVNPAHECVPWWAPGQAPPGRDDVGACIIPP